MKCIIAWCNNNQGFLSAVLAIVSLGVSSLALCLAQKTDRKQYNQALYEKRLFISKKIDELREFTCYLELFKSTLLAQHIESKKQIIEDIAAFEISMDWVYEFRKGKYVVSRLQRKNIINISNAVTDLLRKYGMLKNALKRKTPGTNYVEDIFGDIDKIKDTINNLNTSLEKKLFL